MDLHAPRPSVELIEIVPSSLEETSLLPSRETLRTAIWCFRMQHRSLSSVASHTLHCGRVSASSRTRALSLMGWRFRAQGLKSTRTLPDPILGGTAMRLQNQKRGLGKGGKSVRHSAGSSS